MVATAIGKARIVAPAVSVRVRAKAQQRQYKPRETLSIKALSHGLVIVGSSISLGMWWYAALVRDIE